MTTNHTDALATFEAETDVVHVDVSAVGVLARSETEAQLDAAHKYPRSIGRFMKEAVTLATLTQEVAESCIYALPRGGKSITGPSVRLAEIVASTWGNLHTGKRVIGAEEKEVISQGVAWDLEKNLRHTVETRRRITSKSGKRFDDDMITLTGNAAASIAYRNAVFGVVPGAYVKAIYAKVREVAVGTAGTLVDKRAHYVAKLGKMGVPLDRLLARVDKVTIEDVGLDELETLIGLGTAIFNKDTTIDDAFPPVAKPGATAELEAKLRGPDVKKAKAAASATIPAAPAPAALETCLTCGLPIDGAAVSTTNADGVQGQRHPACAPATEVPTRKPGESGV